MEVGRLLATQWEARTSAPLNGAKPWQTADFRCTIERPTQCDRHGPLGPKSGRTNAAAAKWERP